MKTAQSPQSSENRMSKWKTAAVEELLSLNEQRSAEYRSPQANNVRELYRNQHPTKIFALKCMDGRLNLSVMTGIPLGSIEPFRNIGGIFSLGWPFFGILMRMRIHSALKKGRPSMVIISYHYSKSEPHLGCRGHNYDKHAAQKEAEKLLAQFNRVYGESSQAFCAFVVGIETDEDTLILHGSNGDVLDVGTLIDSSEDDCKKSIRKLFPLMSEQHVHDLVPLVHGNAQWTKKVRETHRPVESLDHCENVLCLGRGFDWLHKPNKAIIIGPYSSDLAKPMSVGAGIILGNLRSGRVSKDDGIVLMAAALHEEAGDDHATAVEKALDQAQTGLRAIHDQVPELLSNEFWPKFDVIVGTVDKNTRYFQVVPFDAEQFVADLQKVHELKKQAA
jgi:hypothetical protein